MKKGAFILCLAICLLFTVSSVYANDIEMASNNIPTMESTQTNEVSCENNEETIEVNDDGAFTPSDNEIESGDALKSEEGSESEVVSFDIITTMPFYELDYLISSNTDEVIDLHTDYYYSDADFQYMGDRGIYIDRSITINGNGHTIDARNQVWIFEISSSMVILNNITFKNANAQTSPGGAVNINSGFECEISNCRFIGNYAETGGAIKMTCYDSKISNCQFIGNHALSCGGDIYLRNFGYVSISNCSFTDSSAEYGGAIYLMEGPGAEVDYASISKCTFTNSSAKYGGAIYLTESGNPYYDFTVEDNYSIANCNFTGNNAEVEGGAVCWFNQNQATISGCNFINNSAEVNGGAVFWCDQNQSTISGCNFNNNHAESGGAVFSHENASNLKLQNSNFVNNTAKHGGASFINSSNSIILGCSFEDNRAVGTDVNGGALSIGEAEVVVSNSSFVNNHGEATHANWGHSIFYYMGDYNRIITGCLFKDDSEDNAAVYINRGNHATITGNIFLVSGNPILFYNSDSIVCTDYNWFGNTGNNYSVNPNVEKCTKWLVLKTEVSSYYIKVFETADIIFKLYVCDCGELKEYDNSMMKPHNLKITSVNGIVDNDVAKFGEAVRFNATSSGTGEIIATWGNFQWGEYVYISKISSGFSIDSQELTYDENLKIPINYNDIATGMITIQLNGKNNSYEFNKQLNNTIVLENVNADEYQVVAIYSGDDKFKKASSFPSLTVTKANSTLNLDYIVFDPNTKGVTNVSFTGAIGVNVEVIPLDDEETYSLTITVIPDCNHVGVSKSITLPLNKIKTEITANSITTTYNVNKNLVITLKDSKGNPIKFAVVCVDLNGAKYYVSDKNGQVKISTKGLAAKTYTAKITFNGSGIYAKSTKNVNVIVKKATPKLTAKSTSFKVKTKAKKYAITLKSNMNATMKNVKVTLKVNKKTYTAKTNAKGKATFNLKKLNKKGTYKATVTYKGNACYNKVTKKVNIKIR